jgi:hypothetical protein
MYSIDIKNLFKWFISMVGFIKLFIELSQPNFLSMFE